jgi:hypothetical protein
MKRRQIKMRKTVLLVTFTVLMLSTGQASAFTHYTQNEFMTAESLDPGMTQTGIHFTLGEHYENYYPEVRYGLGALMEVGVKFGVTAADINSEHKLGALVGVDLKYQLVKETEGVPLDMSVDLGFDNVIINSKNSSELSFSTIFSKGFPLTDRGYKFTPYGGLEMTSLYGSLIPTHDTSVYVFGGLEWKLSQKFMVMLEVKSGKSNVGGVGIRFEY